MIVKLLIVWIGQERRQDRPGNGRAELCAVLYVIAAESNVNGLGVPLPLPQKGWLCRGVAL